MAEIDSYIDLFNKNLVRIQYQSGYQLDHPTVQFLTSLRSMVLENVLLEKGLDVCHYADIHSFCAPPADWKLSDKEWRLGLFPKDEGKLIYRAEVNRTYGGHPISDIVHPELICVCKDHFLEFGIKTSTEQRENGWHQKMYSSVTTINGKLYPIADLSIEINEPQIRKHPEYVYQYFGFTPLQQR